MSGIRGILSSCGNAPRFLLLLGVISGLAAAQSATPRRDIPSIARAANGSVVSVVMYRDGKPVAQGSGFVVSKDGIVVTNYHVIAEGSAAVVKLPDGAFYVVDGVLAFDKVRDVAIIKARDQNFRTVALGNSDQVQVGEEVVAIGNPLSFESTVSNGIVSGVRNVAELGGKFLQVTAPISPGSSGGPLFNMRGEVIGITTLYLKGGENLNFAIPINDVKLMLQAKTTKIQDFPNEPEPNETQPKETHQKATLSEQKICSDQASEILQAERKGDRVADAEFGVVSHYDASTGVCYVRVSRNVPFFEGWLRTFSIYDAFGGGSVGTFIRSLGTEPDFCEIDPPGQPKIDCKSQAEFDELARRYFGIIR